MGAGRASVNITGNDTDARVTNADPNTNGAVFLPTSGNRHHVSGEIWHIGSEGLYWSSTASDLDQAYFIMFIRLFVEPQRTDFRAWAWSVRCIRE